MDIPARGLPSAQPDPLTRRAGRDRPVRSRRPPAWDLAQFAAIAYGGAQLHEPPPLSHDAILTQLVAGFRRTPALLEEMAAYWLILVQRMRRKLGRTPSPWLDSVADEYARRKPCRRQRSTCCALTDMPMSEAAV
jgi:hypothetical protein